MVGNLILGVVMTLLAFLGLVMAALARDDMFHVTGMILLIASVITIFVLINRAMSASKATAQSDAPETAEGDGTTAS